MNDKLVVFSSFLIDGVGGDQSDSGPAAQIPIRIVPQTPYDE